MTNIKNRQTNLDFIRIIACFLVCSVHFFLNSYFYQEPVNSPKMYVFTIIRTGCMTCVPLFLLLTGYLMHGRRPSLRYYWGLEKTLLTYLLAAITCLLFKKYYFKWQIVSVWEIFDFTAAPYAWYIEMYIGLFLLIPFLNILWENLNGKKQKRILLISLIILTTLPSVINIFNFKTPGWWSLPATDATYTKLMPSWWLGIYPITYFFTGAYLKEFPSNYNKPSLFFLLLLSVAGFGMLNIYRSYTSVFVWGDWQNWGSLPVYIMTVLLFRFSESFNMNRLPEVVRRFIAKISDLCLGTYLLSWIADTHIYPKLNATFPNIPDRLIYFFFFPAIIFAFSTFLSFIISQVSLLIHKIVPIKKFIDKRSAT